MTLKNQLEQFQALQSLSRKNYKTLQKNENLEKLLKFLYSGSEKAKNLITDLLRYSTVTSKSDEKELVDINNTVNDLKNSLHALITETQTNIIVSNPLPQIMANKTQVEQLFQNLISNSIKYRDPQKAPLIKISSKNLGEFTEFYIEDNGIGIDPKFHKKIFDIFQRLHRNENISGTGVGLTIVKKIVENMGGEINLESELGVGTKFIFTLKN